MTLLSACIIAKNEEADLPRCLGSLRGLVDEIVVHDTGSDDGTVEIAWSFGAIVVEEMWRYDFAYHRNVSIDATTAEWALIIDADEELVATDSEETRARLKAGGLPDVLLVRMGSAYPGGRLETLLQPRLLRRDSGLRYREPIGEFLDVGERQAALSNLTLHHHGSADVEVLRRKEERNLQIAESMARTPHALHCVAKAASALGMWAKAVEAC